MQKALMTLCALIVVTCCVVGNGCRAPESTLTRAAVIGVYTYTSNAPDDSETDHSWNRLELGADGSFELVEGGPTKQRSETRGTWKFIPGESARVIAGDTAYPVREQGGEIRLLIDDDVGIWYAKKQ